MLKTRITLVLFIRSIIPDARKTGQSDFAKKHK